MESEISPGKQTCTIFNTSNQRDAQF